ncbi:unnamed protein product [Polarella glacialis]|uniref:Metallo-beta-lactamase domain-containing protein n=1 Tax=Polarella glacialis TaxID=89957 RepID=A0A813JP77_POLGL|nr:unnamed protein product [Polarella glacialis]
MTLVLKHGQLAQLDKPNAIDSYVSDAMSPDSKLSLAGTNTYLVGLGPDRVLIDTSDGNARWWPLVRQVLHDEGASIIEVLLTHAHYDHVGGLPELRAAFPEAVVRKCLGSLPGQHDDSVVPPPGALEAQDVRRGINLAAAYSGAQNRRRNKCGCDGHVPEDCLYLEDGQVISVTGCAIKVLLTPGHSDDSACFILETDAGTPAEAVFTGDTILGGRTAMFSDLPSYEMSLKQLLRITRGASDYKGIQLFPGHGEVVKAEDSSRYLASMLMMQAKREKAILQTLKASPGSSSSDLCSVMYSSTAASIMAQDLVDQHLEDLERKGRVRSSSGFFGTTWELGSPGVQPASELSSEGSVPLWQVATAT